MSLTFEEDGIRFQYPENWRLEREENETGWTVTVQSPDTAFFLVSFDGDAPEPQQMAQTTLEALREEYPNLEADACVETVAGQPAVGHDIQFFSLDLTNTCWTRSFSSDRGTILVMWEVNDLELEAIEPVLRAITASLEVEED
jgi:hypothetical protein